MTPLRSKHAGHRIIRVERVGSDKLNSDRVHYVAGGTYHGIVINKAVNGRPSYNINKCKKTAVYTHVNGE